jgi:Zn-finger nucleic acid-binding protein
MIVECPSCHLRYDLAGRPPGTRVRCRCKHEFTLPATTVDSATLSCPSCGGKSSPTATRCEYCGVSLASVRCPRCFALAFAGAKHCAQCGAALTAPARAFHADGSSAMHCPRCRTALTADLVSQTPVDQCDRCGGLWLDHQVFERVLEERRREPTLEVALGSLPAIPVAVDTHRIVYLPCPECAQLMNRKNFAQRSGVIVDLCPAHGVWFDRGELARIVEFVRSGAWERALEADHKAHTTPAVTPALPRGREDGIAIGMETVFTFISSLFH